MNGQTITIVTQTPFSTFDHMVIGIVLVIVMAILGARRLLRMLVRAPAYHQDREQGPGEP